jgi:ribose transport system permease protein
MGAFSFARSRVHYGIWISGILFFTLYLMLTVVSPASRTSFAITGFLVIMTPLALAAVGVTLVMITGGFDLSVAGVISVANVLAATQMQKSPEHVWLIAAAIVIGGVVVGAVNGMMVALAGLQSLGATLASFIILSGVAIVLMPGPGGSVPAEFSSVLTTEIGFVPTALIVILVISLLWIAFTKSRTGIAALSIGADRSATRMSGVHVPTAEIICYALAGGVYALAGLYLAAVTATGDPNAGRPFLLTAFAAMALGLVSFSGGAGSAIGAIFGAGTLIIIQRLLFALGISDFWVGAIQGAVILAALTAPAAARYFMANRRKHRSSARNDDVNLATNQESLL